MNHNWNDCFYQMERITSSTLNETIRNQLHHYVAQLLSWNQTYNLIGPAAVDNLLTRHILNALPLLPLLPECAKIADMGSGAGLPGVILAILSQPDRQFHLYEANQKKTRFLTFIVTELNLENRITIHKKRIEEPHPDSRSYDVTISRALADMETIAKLSRFLLKPNGICLALKGRNVHEELLALQKSKQQQYFSSPMIHSDPDNPEGVIIQMQMVSRETGRHP
ncbi:MAG: 16S rRNA (guanine(527)-N(7))-methyltransferase RsmG [Magnetococcales bacterium]|nr:16S rRNA (guanine(527)-N(7))-methyltransferase RsmG [Magnetococcales bacterium]